MHNEFGLNLFVLCFVLSFGEFVFVSREEIFTVREEMIRLLQFIFQTTEHHWRKQRNIFKVYKLMGVCQTSSSPLFSQGVRRTSNDVSTLKVEKVEVLKLGQPLCETFKLYSGPRGTGILTKPILKKFNARMGGGVPRGARGCWSFDWWTRNIPYS